VVASEHDILDGIALRLRAGWLARPLRSSTRAYRAAPALTAAQRLALYAVAGPAAQVSPCYRVQSTAATIGG
jgi:hypothetical protein